MDKWTEAAGAAGGGRVVQTDEHLYSWTPLDTVPFPGPPPLPLLYIFVTRVDNFACHSHYKALAFAHAAYT